jgi:hypothetical protein
MLHFPVADPMGVFVTQPASLIQYRYYITLLMQVQRKITQNHAKSRKIKPLTRECEVSQLSRIGLS